MATTNQKTVAEALHIARTQSFAKGFTYLEANIPSANLTWFSEKCHEHGIVVPAPQINKEQ